MGQQSYFVEMIQPRLKSGKILKTSDSVQFVRKGHTSNFSVYCAPYLEAFANGICIHDLIRTRFERGEHINFSEIKETISTLYWNGDLENEAAFGPFIETVDGPPEKLGTLFNTFFEFPLSTKTRQLVGGFVGLGFLVMSIAFWLDPLLPMLSVLLLPQTFITIKSLTSSLVNTFMNHKSQQLSLHVSAIGIYLHPTSAKPHAIGVDEYLVRSLFTIILASIGYQFIRQSGFALFDTVANLLLLLSWSICFYPNHKSDLANLRRFLSKNIFEKFVVRAFTVIFFASSATFTFFALDHLIGKFRMGAVTDIGERIVLMILCCWLVGLFLDTLGEFEALRDRTIRFFPRRFRFKNVQSSNIDVNATLKQVPILQSLPPTVLNEMGRFSQVKIFRAGERILREGEHSTDLYVIISGRVGIYTKRISGTRECAVQLGEGSIFGEAGFFLKRPRMGHVYALTETMVLRVQRPANADLTDKFSGEDFHLFQRKIWAFQSLISSEMFQYTPTEIIREIVQKAQLVELPEGKVIFRQGDSADALWVIVQGTCQAQINNKPVRNMDAGDVFGEIGILRKSKRTAQVVTLTPCVLLKVETILLWEILSCNLNLGLTIQNVARERFYSQSA